MSIRGQSLAAATAIAFVASTTSLIPLVTPSASAATTPATPTREPSICSLASGNRTTVAAINGKEIKVRTNPSDTAPIKTLKNWVDVKGRVVFTVRSQTADWIDVNVPARPNGSHGYIRASDVTTFQHSCRIEIQLSTKKLRAYVGDDLLLEETVAIGQPKYPTPTGTFFTTSLIRPIKRVGKKKVADPVFGPYAYTLSGFSPNLETFGGGVGTLGIHGTNQPTLLGQEVSHGCIRMSNSAITKLAKILPVGVPVEIKA